MELLIGIVCVVSVPVGAVLVLARRKLSEEILAPSRRWPRWIGRIALYGLVCEVFARQLFGLRIRVADAEIGDWLVLLLVLDGWIYGTYLLLTSQVPNDASGLGTAQTHSDAGTSQREAFRMTKPE